MRENSSSSRKESVLGRNDSSSDKVLRQGRWGRRWGKVEAGGVGECKGRDAGVEKVARSEEQEQFMKDKEEGRRSYRDSSNEASFGKDGTPHTA